VTSVSIDHPATLVQGEHPDTLEGRTLVLAQTFEFVAFAWQPRRKNAIAHQLARKATTDCPRTRRPKLFP